MKKYKEIAAKGKYIVVLYDNNARSICKTKSDYCNFA